MTGDMHLKAPASELLDVTPLPAPGEDYHPGSVAYTKTTHSIFHLREPNMTEMLTLMKPMPPEAECPKDFFIDDLEFLPKTIYHILRHTLCPVKGHSSLTRCLVPRRQWSTTS